MGTEDELWLPPSFKDQKRSKRRAKYWKRFLKGAGFADKTLWDWFQFFGVIAIPFVIAAGTLFITQQQTQRDQELATDQQRETALQSYLSDLSDLLLNHQLRESKDGDEVRQVARARTLTVLERLDPSRKAAVLQFLDEAQLITGAADVPSVVSLFGADLTDATLTDATLMRADLTGANLRPSIVNPLSIGYYLNTALIVSC